MDIEIAPGLEHTLERNVTRDVSAPHLPHVVLATPAMVGLIERACYLAVEEALGPERTTVGTHICVSHRAAALEDEVVTVRCRLTELEGRRLTFDVSVDTDRARIGEGTHERAVVSLQRFAEPS